MRAFLSSLKSTLPDVTPSGERKLTSLLRAARHIQRYPATDTKRGRRGYYDRSLLIKVAARASDILERETSSRVSFASFVDHYLRLLEFPSDVLDALTRGDINLFEAGQMARLTPHRLSVSTAQAKRTRRELLTAHLSAQLSSTRLRARINELLATTRTATEEKEETTPEELESFDPFDPTHLFWDQIKQLGFALRDIRPEDINEQELEEFLKYCEPVMNFLNRIKRRKERRIIKIQI